MNLLPSSNSKLTVMRRIAGCLSSDSFARDMADPPHTRWETFSRLHDEEVKAYRPSTSIIVKEGCEAPYEGDSCEVQYDAGGDYDWRLTGLATQSTTPTLRNPRRDEPVPNDIDVAFFQPSATQRLHLLHLPPEILERIFLHSGPNAFAQLSKTCKTLHQLAWTHNGLLWKQLLVHNLTVELPDLLPVPTGILLSEFKKRVCAHDHFGDGVLLCGGVGGVRLCAPCRKDWMAARRKAAREEKLKGTLAKYGMESRIDNTLCQDFIKERNFIHPKRLSDLISDMFVAAGSAVAALTDDHTL